MLANLRDSVVLWASQQLAALLLLERKNLKIVIYNMQRLLSTFVIRAREFLNPTPQTLSPKSPGLRRQACSPDMARSWGGSRGCSRLGFRIRGLDLGLLGFRTFRKLRSFGV